ncbi:MAG: zeta toxin family protein [Parcubacteria group bacterium]|jgi:hypothetical protein
MELSEQDKKTQQEAIKYIESHSEELIDRFIVNKRPLPLGVLTFFMAGSPGAGKTEFSRRYMPAAIDKNNRKIANSFRKMGIDINKVDTLFVRIDVDEIREFMPQYVKTNAQTCSIGNAHIVQKAATKGLDILRKYCFKNDISFLHDGTFGNYNTMRDLIKKSLRSGREVEIFYIYLDPLEAWKLTEAREFVEGRNIIKDKFVDQFFASRENVDKIKQEFGNKVKLNCIIKDKENKVEEIRLNVDNVDKFIKKYYNKKSIPDYTREGLLRLISSV